MGYLQYHAAARLKGQQKTGPQRPTPDKGPAFYDIIEEHDLPGKVEARLNMKPLTIDVDALKPGAYEINKNATGTKEVNIIDKGAMPLRFSLELVLELRAKFRSGAYSYRMLSAEYKINLKQLQEIMRGEHFTIEIKRHENLDVTGAPLSLKGQFTRQGRNAVKPRNSEPSA